MHSINAEGKIELVSNKWLQNFGYTREEVIGQFSTHFLTHESLQLARKVLPQFFEQGHCTDIPYTWVCKDGSLRNVLLSATATRDAQGKVTRSLAVLHDVTDLYAAQARAQRERSFRDRFFDSSTDAFVLADSKRNILALNKAAETLFQWNSEEIQGKPTRMLYATAEDFQHRGQTHFHSKGPTLTQGDTYRMLYSKKNGETFLGETSGGVLRDPHGEIEGFLGIIRDITQEVQSRQTLENTNRKLEASLEALDQFAYIASHDLKTPLRGIKHLVSFIEEDAPPELLHSVQKWIDLLRERADYLDHIIQALVRFARFDYAAAPIVALDVQAIIESMLNNLQYGAPNNRKFTATLDFSQLREPLVEVDSVAFEHALLNIITNSISHHDNPSIHLIVSAEHQHESLWVHVEDDGPGILPQHHERIFKLFQTLQAKEHTSHTGMGLTIVRRLIARAGGTVSLTSPVCDNRGTRFSFSLPIANPVK